MQVIIFLKSIVSLFVYIYIILNYFKTFLCEHMNMKQFKFEFFVQKGRSYAKCFINLTKELKNHLFVNTCSF